jgi:hypothetical protein
LKPIDWQNIAALARRRCADCFIAGDLDGWQDATRELQLLLADRARRGGPARRRTQDGNLASFVLPQLHTPRSEVEREPGSHM